MYQARMSVPDLVAGIGEGIYNELLACPHGCHKEVMCEVAKGEKRDDCPMKGERLRFMMILWHYIQTGMVIHDEF